MDKKDVQKALETINLCDEYKDDELKVMGKKICQWFDDDEEARRPWRMKSEQWLKLATQVVEKKTYPWPDSANVKYPLLTTAAMQFSARAYPALVPGPNLVNGLVIGLDQDGSKDKSATRVGRHMSYQLLYEMKGWEEDMDRLCLMLPIVGCMFKKTFYDELRKRNCSELIMPNDLVIDYYAKSIESANRKSHVVYKTKNEVKERVNKELWRNVDLGAPQNLAEEMKVRDQIQGMNEPDESPASPYKFLECHCWWDSDDDGYEEPYIITVHYDTQQVVRIVARYEIDGVEYNAKDEVIRIEPVEYFTKFGFIPNPDGSIYDLGFGLLLGGINETVNTLTNQLLDAGTLNNLQAGFLGKGIRVRGGNTRFIPGEWKPVDFTGDDIKKHIFPIPTKEPSDVLFKLLETLVTSGKELASVAEIMVGKMPGQNTPATTTMATIEQGLKVFTAIYKRVYRSLGHEYEKLFRLNSIQTDEPIYFTINEPQGPQGQVVYKQDYDPKNIGVKPNADPNVVSQAQKLMQVQSMGPLLQLGTINPRVYTARYLEAIGEENIAELTSADPQPQQPGQPPQGPQPYHAPPSPEQQQAQADIQLKQLDGQLKSQLAQQKMQFEQQKAALEAQGKKQDAAMAMLQAHFAEQKEMLVMMTEAAKAKIQMGQEAVGHAQEVVHKEVGHRQDMRHAEEEHQQGLKQQEEQSAAKVEAIKAQAEAQPAPQGE